MIERVYYNNDYEDFKIIYKENNYVLVKNITTKSSNKYSFGLYEDLHSFYGFPVNQSCLNKKETINKLNRFIKIAKDFNDINKTIDIYKNMIKSLKAEEV